MRGFEKISYEQFKKDIAEDKFVYNNYKLPVRKTKVSAGYDFFALEDFILKPGEIKTIPTGYKVYMNSDELLYIYVRSSTGFKYNVRMCNQVGVIDSDYYNNIDNEGHMFVKLENHGKKDYIVKKGESYAQGVFSKYLIVDNEDEITTDRTGGIGSTNEREKENE